MKIGIIGAGQIGATLARKFAAIGHQVKIANSRGPGTLVDVASQTGAIAMETIDVVRDVDVVVIAIPEVNIEQLPKDLFDDTPPNTIVIDTGNYFPTLHGRRIDDIESGLTESNWVSQQIGRPVIKVFNSISAPSLAVEGRDPSQRIALPIAGDDSRAKATVVDLVEAIGFDAIDAGGLDESWRQQPGTPAFCADLEIARLRTALGSADREQSPIARDIAIAKILESYNK